VADKWFQRSLRRNLLDFHIDDWHPEFLTRYEPARFADAVVHLGSTAATVFANTHTGLCNYPTAVGEMHRGHHGRDVFGETIRELHARGIDVVVYYVMIFADWYWDRHPEARIVDANGDARKVLIASAGRPRRFSTTCPNDPAYRAFVVAQIEEICAGYEFEGVWPDMTFWPTVCYCASCRARFRAEVGGEPPRVIDWSDPSWVRFQRKRQEWMAEFGALVTDTFRRGKPGVSVAHQSLAFHADWVAGGSDALASVTDWASADLYGERYGLSFFAKLFRAISTTLPFEHINTWSWPDIHEHVVMRTEDHLRLTAYSALMHHGAMVLIDAVDPEGTIHDPMFDRGGRVYADVARYEAEVGGELCQDVGIWYSFDSNIDLADDGRAVAEAGYTFDREVLERLSPTVHRNVALSLARTLIAHHVPFGVVTRRDLDHLSDWQVIVLPNVAMLRADEVAALRAFVAAGGSLIASKHSSLLTTEGARQADFQLADVFGVSYAGESADTVTYVAPAGVADELFGVFTPQWPSTLYDTQTLVTAHADAEVLATVTLPWTHPTETRYASILTDPPGIATTSPAVVRHRFGEGRAMYWAGVLETWRHESQEEVVIDLITSLRSRAWWVELEAPRAVEATLFLQADRDRYLLNIIDYQQELPNIPIHDVGISVRMAGRTPTAVRMLPDGAPLAFERSGDRVTFRLAELRDFAMIAIDLEAEVRD
jgi:hypothetical protein